MRRPPELQADGIEAVDVLTFGRFISIVTALAVITIK